MSMRLAIAMVFAAVFSLAPAARGGEEAEKLLLGFEKDEMPAGGLLWKDMDKQLTDEQASQGRTSLFRKHNDRYNFLNPGNKTTFYNQWRTGGELRTLGWFEKVFPADWSGYDLLRIDYRTDAGAAKVRLEIEDLFCPFPAAKVYEVPGGKWVTLEMDLGKAASERRLDLKRMAHLLLMVVEHPAGKQEFTCWIDNLRLARRGAPAKLEVVAGGPFLEIEPGGAQLAKRAELAPLDVSKTAKADGQVHAAVELAKPGGYPLIYVNERCIGGFGDGGIILATSSAPMLSLDSGKTWAGLGGKPSAITPDHRGQHRSQTMIAGTDVFMAYCTAHCGGGGARVTAKFTRALREGDKWVTGPESLVDVTARYCHDRFALCRAKSGRLWCAWSHLNRLHKKDIRAKWSQDNGETWLQAGENARVGERGVFHFPGTPGNYEGPYLTAFGEEVACFWHREPDGDVVWTRAMPLEAKAGEVKDGRVTIPLGAKQGVRRDDNVLVEKGGKVAAVLTVDQVGEESCVAIELPGPAGAVKAGDELTVIVWTAEEVIMKGEGGSRSRTPRPHSAATAADGTAYLAVTAPSKVLRFEGEGKKWVEDSPAGLGGKPMLVAWGGKMACLWAGEGGIFLSVRGEGGKWSAARKVAEETEAVQDLAAPQVAPEKFIPAAWSPKSNKTIKVVAVPMGE